MSPEDRRIHDALVAMPPNDRLAALACSILGDEPNALSGVAALVSVAAILGRRLAREQRTAFAFHLMREAATLDARWQ